MLNVNPTKALLGAAAIWFAGMATGGGKRRTGGAVTVFCGWASGGSGDSRPLSRALPRAFADLPVGGSCVWSFGRDDR